MREPRRRTIRAKWRAYHESGSQTLALCWSDWVLFHARIQSVAQSVAQECEGEHRDGDDQGRENGQVRGGEDAPVTVLDEGSPTGVRGRKPDTDEAESRLGDDGSGDTQCDGHNDRSEGIGQDVAQQDRKSV